MKTEKQKGAKKGNFVKSLIGKLDKKLQEKVKAKSCCGPQEKDSDKTSCCG